MEKLTKHIPNDKFFTQDTFQTYVHTQFPTSKTSNLSSSALFSNLTFDTNNETLPVQTWINLLKVVEGSTNDPTPKGFWTSIEELCKQAESRPQRTSITNLASRSCSPSFSRLSDSQASLSPSRDDGVGDVRYDRSLRSAGSLRSVGSPEPARDLIALELANEKERKEALESELRALKAKNDTLSSKVDEKENSTKILQQKLETVILLNEQLDQTNQALRRERLTLGKKVESLSERLDDTDEEMYEKLTKQLEESETTLNEMLTKKRLLEKQLKALEEEHEREKGDNQKYTETIVKLKKMMIEKDAMLKKNEEHLVEKEAEVVLLKSKLMEIPEKQEDKSITTNFTVKTTQKKEGSAIEYSPSPSVEMRRSTVQLMRGASMEQYTSDYDDPRIQTILTNIDTLIAKKKVETKELREGLQNLGTRLDSLSETKELQDSTKDLHDKLDVFAHIFIEQEESLKQMKKACEDSINLLRQISDQKESEEKQMAELLGGQRELRAQVAEVDRSVLQKGDEAALRQASVEGRVAEAAGGVADLGGQLRAQLGQLQAQLREMGDRPSGFDTLQDLMKTQEWLSSAVKTLKETSFQKDDGESLQASLSDLHNSLEDKVRKFSSDMREMNEDLQRTVQELENKLAAQTAGVTGLQTNLEAQLKALGVKENQHFEEIVEKLEFMHTGSGSQMRSMKPEETLEPTTGVKAVLKSQAELVAATSALGSKLLGKADGRLLQDSVDQLAGQVSAEVEGILEEMRAANRPTQAKLATVESLLARPTVNPDDLWKALDTLQREVASLKEAQNKRCAEIVERLEARGTHGGSKMHSERPQGEVLREVLAAGMQNHSQELLGKIEKLRGSMENTLLRFPTGREKMIEALNRLEESVQSELKRHHDERAAEAEKLGKAVTKASEIPSQILQKMEKVEKDIDKVLSELPEQQKERLKELSRVEECLRKELRGLHAERKEEAKLLQASLAKAIQLPGEKKNEAEDLLKEIGGLLSTLQENLLEGLHTQAGNSAHAENLQALKRSVEGLSMKEALTGEEVEQMQKIYCEKVIDDIKSEMKNLEKAISATNARDQVESVSADVSEVKSHLEAALLAQNFESLHKQLAAVQTNCTQLSEQLEDMKTSGGSKMHAEHVKKEVGEHLKVLDDGRKEQIEEMKICVKDLLSSLQTQIASLKIAEISSKEEDEGKGEICARIEDLKQHVEQTQEIVARQVFEDIGAVQKELSSVAGRLASIQQAHAEQRAGDDRRREAAAALESARQEAGTARRKELQDRLRGEHGETLELLQTIRDSVKKLQGEVEAITSEQKGLEHSLVKPLERLEALPTDVARDEDVKKLLELFNERRKNPEMAEVLDGVRALDSRAEQQERLLAEFPGLWKGGLGKLELLLGNQLEIGLAGYRKVIENFSELQQALELKIDGAETGGEHRALKSVDLDRNDDLRDCVDRIIEEQRLYKEAVEGLCGRQAEAAEGQFGRVSAALEILKHKLDGHEGVLRSAIQQIGDLDSRLSKEHLPAGEGKRLEDERALHQRDFEEMNKNFTELSGNIPSVAEIQSLHEKFHSELLGRMQLHKEEFLEAHREVSCQLGDQWSAEAVERALQNVSENYKTLENLCVASHNRLEQHIERSTGTITQNQNQMLQHLVALGKFEPIQRLHEGLTVQFQCLEKWLKAERNENVKVLNNTTALKQQIVNLDSAVTNGFTTLNSTMDNTLASRFGTLEHEQAAFYEKLVKQQSSIVNCMEEIKQFLEKVKEKVARTEEALETTRGLLNQERGNNTLVELNRHVDEIKQVLEERGSEKGLDGGANCDSINRNVGSLHEKLDSLRKGPCQSVAEKTVLLGLLLFFIVAAVCFLMPEGDPLA